MKTRILYFLSIFLLFIPTAATADTSTALKSLMEESRAQADIVEAVQNAVVHIKVERIIKAGSRGNMYNNPFDLFRNSPFEHFFPEYRNMPDQNRQPREFRQQGSGSGTIIDKEGHILTNNHVVGEADKITVSLLDGREFDAEVIGTDPLTDIAVIKIDADNLTVLPMGDSDAIRIGETVIAIGNPFGLSHTVTMGIISAKGRSNMDIADYEDFIQTDAAINPGNSGGPLINLEGRIIGVNTAIFSRTGGYQGIGFAVPINMAANVMDQLIKKGEVTRGWLGIYLQDITNELKEAMNLEDTRGALISQVAEGSPAEKGGLKRGDVIIKFEGKAVEDAEHLKNLVGMELPGEKVFIEVSRKGEMKALTVTLGNRSTQSFAQGGTYGFADPLGVKVQEITPDLARQFGYQRVVDGVIITDVAPNSPAAGAGLQPGLLILEVNYRDITNMDSFNKAMENADIDRGILLLIGSQRGAQYIIVKSQ